MSATRASTQTHPPASAPPAGFPDLADRGFDLPIRPLSESAPTLDQGFPALAQAPFEHVAELRSRSASTKPRTTKTDYRPLSLHQPIEQTLLNPFRNVERAGALAKAMQNPMVRDELGW
jgi:hypothetical protein